MRVGLARILANAGKQAKREPLYAHVLTNGAAGVTSPLDRIAPAAAPAT